MGSAEGDLQQNHEPVSTGVLMTNRSQVSVSIEENSVLIGILQGKKNKIIVNQSGLSTNRLRVVRQNLMRKFRAKTSAHLCVLATLERAYFQILYTNNTEVKIGDLTEKEVEIAKLVLQGFTNRQIADQFGVSTKTVDFHRRNFRIKSNVYSHSEFVKACIINGILLIAPVSYQRGSERLTSIKIDQFNLDHWSVPLNKYGSVYFDFQNRFVIDCAEGGSGAPLNHDPRLLGARLSDVPMFALIQSGFRNDVEIKLFYETFERFNKRLGHEKFLKNLQSTGVLKIVIQHIMPSNLKHWSHLITMEHLLLGSSIEKIADRTKLSEEEIRKKIDHIFGDFECVTEISLLIQAKHFGLLSNNS